MRVTQKGNPCRDKAVTKIRQTRNHPKVSAVIICYNEEDNILRCLNSLVWTDEIVVVDSFSTDRTIVLCKKHTGEVYQKKWPGIVRQREHAISLAKNEWVLAIDADEAATRELRDEILSKLSEDKNENDGYYMKRHSFYLGRWINHGGWYPDYKLRLFRKDKVYVGGENPHEKCFVNGKTQWRGRPLPLQRHIAPIADDRYVLRYCVR